MEEFDRTDPADIDGPFETVTKTMSLQEYEELQELADYGRAVAFADQFNLHVFRFETAAPENKWSLGPYTAADLIDAWEKYKEGEGIE